jgi:hypothetical protein
MNALSHPLFLLLAGGVLSGLLLPRLARQWHDRQKVLDLKTSLIADMSEAVVRMLSRVTAVRILRTWLPSSAQESGDEINSVSEQYNDAFTDMNSYSFEFQAQQAIIRAKLRVYFSEQVEEEWNRLADTVLTVCGMEGVYDAEKRRQLQDEVRSKILSQLPSTHALDVDWADHNDAWERVRNALFLWQQSLNQLVLTKRSSLDSRFW